MRLINLVMLIFLPVLLSGCATTSGDYCDISRTINWDDTEQLMQTPIPITIQIVEHNTVYESQCK